MISDAANEIESYSILETSTYIESWTLLATPIANRSTSRCITLIANEKNIIAPPILEKIGGTNFTIVNWNIDDRRFPKANEKKYIVLKKNPDVGLVYNWWIFSDKENENINNLSKTIRPFQSTPPEHHMWDWSCACGPDPMWRKSLHDQVGYFNQEEFPSCADWDMW